MERTLEPPTATPEQPQGGAYVVREPRELPRVVGDGLLRELLDISADTYTRRKKRGEYAFLLLKPQTSGHTEYSGALVARWLDGEDLSAIGGSRFFAKGRSAGQHAERRTRAGRPKGRANQVSGVAVLGHTETVAPSTAERTRNSLARKGVAR